MLFYPLTFIPYLSLKLSPSILKQSDVRAIIKPGANTVQGAEVITAIKMKIYCIWGPSCDNFSNVS